MEARMFPKPCEQPFAHFVGQQRHCLFDIAHKLEVFLPISVGNVPHRGLGFPLCAGQGERRPNPRAAHAQERGGWMHAGAFKNTILSRMDPAAVDRLQLLPMRFALGDEIECPGEPVSHLYFVEEGMVSMTATFKDGSQVEVGMFGYESIIGVSALMGTKRSLNRAYTQVEGYGFASPLSAAHAEFTRGGLFQGLALRYVQAQLVQSMQSAACNAKHHLEQRLARWLLTTADRVHATTFKLSQEFLADMLGNTRSTVSRAASALKDEDLIDYSRGTVHILDLEQLQQRTCECYAIIKNHLDNYDAFDGDHLG